MDKMDEILKKVEGMTVEQMNVEFAQMEIELDEDEEGILIARIDSMGIF
jgi:hypothetical protein